MTINSIPFTAAGNLTHDPELRFTGTGKPGAYVRLATTPRRYNPAEGSYADGTTTLVDARVWGEQAEYLVESLHREDRVLVVGRWATRVFTPSVMAVRTNRSAKQLPANSAAGSSRCRCPRRRRRTRW